MTMPIFDSGSFWFLPDLRAASPPLWHDAQPKQRGSNMSIRVIRKSNNKIVDSFIADAREAYAVAEPWVRQGLGTVSLLREDGRSMELNELHRLSIAEQEAADAKFRGDGGRMKLLHPHIPTATRGRK